MRVKRAKLTREEMVERILATDFSKHGELMATFYSQFVLDRYAANLIADMLETMRGRIRNKAEAFDRFTECFELEVLNDVYGKGFRVAGDMEWDYSFSETSIRDIVNKTYDIIFDPKFIFPKGE